MNKMLGLAAVVAIAMLAGCSSPPSSPQGLAPSGANNSTSGRLIGTMDDWVNVVCNSARFDRGRLMPSATGGGQCADLASRGSIGPVGRYEFVWGTYRNALVGGHRRVQRDDELVGLLVGQRSQVEHFDRPLVGRPAAVTPGQHCQQPTSGGAEQRAEHLDGGWVEPVNIFRDHQAWSIAQARQQVALDRPGDQLLQLAAFSRHWVIAVLGGDANHRRKQWHLGRWIQPVGGELSVEEPQ